jgi:hypothetical protein
VVKVSRLWSGLLAASLVSASAQVTVEVTQEQEQFLEGEALPIAVRIINRSGQPLHLGAEADWLTFSVESRDGSVVSRNGDAPVLGEFLLESSKAGIKRLDLQPYFAISQPGRYAITATVHIKEWGQDISSRPRNFDIIEGAKLWEQEIGVPRTGASGPPEVRKYILQQANYIKGHLRLYLRVTDAYGKALRVFAIGPMVSFGRPDPPQVDRFSNLHVIYQNGPSSFSYTVFNPDGELVTRQVYDYINTRPRLFANEDGDINVKGGSRRLTANDVPAPKSDDDEETSAPAALSAGNSPAASTPATTEQKPSKP